jgi:hypothetical protein
MIKTNSNFFIPRTFIAKKDTENVYKDVLNQSEKYVINNNTSRTIEDEKLDTDRNISLEMHKFDSKEHSPYKALEKPFTNEFLSTALSPNLQKQK